MKKKIPSLLSYNSKKLDYKNKSKIPLSSRLSYLNDLYSLSSINKANKSASSQILPKNINKTVNSSYLKNQKMKKKLLFVFRDPKEKYKKKFVWPKITHPKLPFSERNTISPEEKKKKIMDQKPSHLFHDIYTINWLRHKYSDSLIEKSIFSMLPDNGKPVVPDDESEEDKKHRLLMEYLDSLYRKGPEREQYVNINPKYFFDKRTFEKILKFKAIFLEFDEDQSRKMEIDEMVEMFNQNHIHANLLDLKNLFFKGKNVKEEDIMKLYLDFYQFMNFALTKDQDFREFMREIKLKNKKKEEGIIGNKDDEEDDNGYLPMNFNLMFDYFLIKGKERASIEAIENSITEMDKIINNNKEEDENELELFLNNTGNKLSSELDKNLKVRRSNSINKEEENNDNSKYYDDQLKNLNFTELMQNFTNLFTFNEPVNNGSELRKQASVVVTDNISSKSSNIEQEEKKTKNNDNKLLRKISKNQKFNILLKDEDDRDDSMDELIKNQMNRKLIKNLNIKNYKKYRNVKLALNATKEQIKKFMNSIGNNVNNIYKIQINDVNNNNKEIKIIDNKLPTLNNSSKKNFNKNNDIEKELFKNKAHLFNRTLKTIKEQKGKNRIQSFGTIGNLNLNNTNNKLYNRNDFDSIKSIYSYNNKKASRSISHKFDYVPPELLNNKNDDKLY